MKNNNFLIPKEHLKDMAKAILYSSALYIDGFCFDNINGEEISDDDGIPLLTEDEKEYIINQIQLTAIKELKKIDKKHNGLDYNSTKGIVLSLGYE